MAFKMKNPSMAKMVKAAGDSRAAMKMKMEEKAAAKMKRESAMKMEKESMAKLMDKASAMKRRSDDDDKSKTNKDSEMQQKLEEKAAEGDRMAKLALKYRRGGKLTKEELEFINNYSKEDKSATPMKKSPIKADIPEVEITDEKTEKGSANRRNPDGTTTAIETKDTSDKGLTDQKKLDVMKSRIRDGQITDRAVVRNKETGKLSYRSLTDSMDGYKVIAKPSTRQGGAATKMGHKSATKMKKEEVGVTKSGRKAFVKDEGAGKFKKVKGKKSKTLSTGPGRPNTLTKKNVFTGKTTTKEVSQKRANKFMEKVRKGVAKNSPAKQKMNMVKGPDGKMVPDFAVDGKGANDMKSGAKMKKPMKMKKK